MAEIVWTEPALSDLYTIADYVALENPVAASAMVKGIFGHIERLLRKEPLAMRAKRIKA